MDRTNRIADALMNNGIKYDFGLQTGDAVDNGAKLNIGMVLQIFMRIV